MKKEHQRRREPAGTRILPRAGSFQHVTDDRISDHLQRARYGDFVLTDAIRPSCDLQIVPIQGYTRLSYRDESTQSLIPVLMAAASRERLFDTFLDLLGPLGTVVDVVLETAHEATPQGIAEVRREHIDMPVLQSILWEYEDMLCNDGFLGIAVRCRRQEMEVHFDEHKLLIVYGDQLAPFEHRLRRRAVRYRQEMEFIPQAEHLHSSCTRYVRKFDELCTRLGTATT